MFSHIPHTSFPFDESPWITHFRDSAKANQNARMGAAGSADNAGHDAFARHILNAADGTNPFQDYAGPFGEGEPGHQVVPGQPPQLYQEYFGNYTPPGGAPGMGPFANPQKATQSGAAGPYLNITPGAR